MAPATQTRPGIHTGADPSDPSEGLQRRLGPLDAAAIVVSNVIGGGIFIVPPIVAGLAPDPMAMLGVWVAGGLLALAGAMAYAELAAMRPHAGAEYVYLHAAFGPFAAFLTGWTSFVAGFSGAIAASAVFLGDTIARFVPALHATPLVALDLPFLSLSISPRTLVALGSIALLSVIHIRGLGPGSFVQNLLASLKVGGLVLFVTLGFTIGDGVDAPLAAVAGASVTVTGFLLALVPVMFSYSGWNAAAYVAEEVRNPGRNVPLALAIGTGAVILIYVLLNLLYLYAMPIATLAGGFSGGALEASAERLFDFPVSGSLAAFTIVAVTASISAMIFAGPRVYFAMARDGLFPAWAAHVHRRFHTPARSIVAQGLWSGILVCSGTLSQLVSYTGFAVVLFTGIAVAGLFVLRWRYPEEPRPFSTWGYPLAPAIYVVAAAAMVINEIVSRPGPSLAGVVIIAAGTPIYLWLRWRRR